MNKNNNIRPSAEIRFAEELKALADNDTQERPPGWKLSPKAVIHYLLGGPLNDQITIEPKYLGNKKVLELCIATLLTDRGLLLMGLPGTAKSWLSEHLAAAISGTSSSLIQGTVGLDENQLKYHWNYAELLQKGPSSEALVKSPIIRAMEGGYITRVEELTRMPTEIQDILITVLSEKMMSIPELNQEVYAVKGFNIIATANDRDKGVHDLSAALRRRFNMVYLSMPETLQEEIDIIHFRLGQIQKDLGLDKYKLPLQHLSDLVTIFRELRTGLTEDKKNKIKSPGSSLSTAEVLSVLQTGIQHSIYFGNGLMEPGDIATSIHSTVVKDKNQDQAAWNEYVESIIKSRKGWNQWYDAFHEISQA
ncbi:MAG: AAA family ATPase [Saprospiraceae bacterium]|jgi:MoxR-like ATPase|nr:AAA family ATPase [Saprospiraceae bacterium]MCA0334746.1 AAA family ATPase [Bacteroidota bacterium]MCB0604265.1 AAA family ATPase [Saprospiraceae bacterium]